MRCTGPDVMIHLVAEGFDDLVGQCRWLAVRYKRGRPWRAPDPSLRIFEVRRVLGHRSRHVPAEQAAHLVTVAVTPPCRRRRDSSTTRRAGSVGSPPASPPTPPGGRGR